MTTAQDEEPPTIMEMYAERDGRIAKLRFAVNLIVITAAISAMAMVDKALPEREKKKLARDVERFRYQVSQVRLAWRYLRGER